MADFVVGRFSCYTTLRDVTVLGVQSVTIHPTPEADAHGWSDAFGSLPLLLNAGRSFSTDGRGERDSPSLTQQPAGFLLVNRTPRREPAVERTA